MTISTTQNFSRNYTNPILCCNSEHSIASYMKWIFTQKKPVLIFVTLIMCALSSLAQSSGVEYLDRNRKVQVGSAGAWFTRTCSVDELRIHHVETFLVSSGALVMSGSYSDMALTTEQGYFKYYFDNGTQESEGEYEEGMKQGDWKRWEWTGEAKPDRFYPCCDSNNM